MMRLRSSLPLFVALTSWMMSNQLPTNRNSQGLFVPAYHPLAVAVRMSGTVELEIDFGRKKLNKVVVVNENLHSPKTGQLPEKLIEEARLALVKTLTGGVREHWSRMTKGPSYTHRIVFEFRLDDDIEDEWTRVYEVRFNLILVERIVVKAKPPS